jgi:hypothetical protein
MFEKKVYPVRVERDGRWLRWVILPQNYGQKMDDGFEWRPTPLAIVPDGSGRTPDQSRALADIIADALDRANAVEETS